MLKDRSVWSSVCMQYPYDIDFTCFVPRKDITYRFKEV